MLPSVVKINVTGAEGAGSGSGHHPQRGRPDPHQQPRRRRRRRRRLAQRLVQRRHHRRRRPSLGTDPLTDTAVIQAEGVSGLTPATIGKSSDLEIGQGVVAIGSPFGLESTVTSGIVSALNRPVNVGDDGEGNTTTYPAIQTDAAINPGNSGGALVDLDGNVVGINSSIRTAALERAAGSIGLGFAIPIDAVLPIVDQMGNGETPTHARLGITVGDVRPRTGSAEVTAGRQIQEVGDGSAAENAGLESGDVITKVDDHLITGADSLVATIRVLPARRHVTVTWLRDGESKTADLSSTRTLPPPTS